MDVIERRRKLALNAIKQSLDSSEQEGVRLFVNHHLGELPDEYWQTHCGTTSPQPQQVLELLTLQSHWGEDDEDDEEEGDDEEGIDTFDFSLPGDVTNYVLSVTFDENGDVAEITMES